MRKGKTRVLERGIESRFLRHLKELWPTSKTRKMNGYGNKGWPDRLVALPMTPLFLIEFKRPGGELSAIQKFILSELTALGIRVYVCDDVTQAIIYCEAEYLRANHKKTFQAA